MAEASAPAQCPEGHDDTVKLLSTVSVGGRAGRWGQSAGWQGAGASGAEPSGGGGCCGGACGCR